MKIVFLGTSAGKPTKKRSVSSLAFKLKDKKEWFMIDCGEGTQRQLLNIKLSDYRLSNIFITHLHADHWLGLPGLIFSMRMQRREKELNIYAPKGLNKRLEAVCNKNLSEFTFKINIFEFDNYEVFNFEEFDVEILPLVHTVESYAFYIIEKQKYSIDKEKLIKDGLQPSKLYAKIKNKKDVVYNNKIYKYKEYLLPQKRRRVIIAGDNEKPKVLKRYLKDLDLLIHESTYSDKDYKKLGFKLSHTTSKKLAKVIKKYNVKNLVVNHISPSYESKKNSLKDIKREILKNYSGVFYIAKDFMELDLSKDGVLTKLTYSS